MARNRMTSKMASGPAVKCMRIMMTVFNLIIAVTGIAFLAVGVWMLIDLYRYMALTDVYTPYVPYVVIGIGAGIFIVGALGCCCTFKQQACLLYVYSGSLMVIFVIELGIGISGFVYRKKIVNGFENGLKKALESYPVDKADAVDGLQQKLRCCGLDEYEDWFQTPWAQVQNKFAVPKSCCAVDESTCVNTWDQEPMRNTSIDDIYTRGCFTLITSFVDENFGRIGGAAIGLSFLQLVGALLACCLAQNINKAKYEQVT